MPLDFGRPNNVGQRLEQHNGITSGFDYLRLFLAVYVLSIHAMGEITTGKNMFLFQPPVRPVTTIGLPMFFALSGFLVTASLARTRNLVRFFSFRAVRILPALAVEVTLSALLLGPLFTTLPLGGYFSDGNFYAYFGNILGIIHYVLPGVFETNPNSLIVNRSLWTIPFELYCYAGLALIVFTGLIKRTNLSALMLATYLVGRSLIALVFDTENSNFGPSGELLVLAFLCGSLAYSLRAHIPLSGSLFAGSMAGCLLLLQSAEFSFLAIPLITYMTICIGLLTPPKKTFLMRGDYSYGVYLFAYPIQQAVCALMPAYRVWWTNIIVSLPLCLTYAAFSWHCIEKPCLERKNVVADLLEERFKRHKK